MSDRKATRRDCYRLVNQRGRAWEQMRGFCQWFDAQRAPASVSGYRKQRRKRGRWWGKGAWGCWDSLNNDQRRYWLNRWREIERERRLRDLWLAERAWPGRESNERGRQR